MKKRCLVIGVFVAVTTVFWSGFAVDARPSDESTITTGLSDALYGISFMDNFSPKYPTPLDTLPRGPNGGYLLGPGAYSGTIFSYCLRSGTYAPYEGDGYLYAPLKGPQAEVIRKILKRSVLHPEIPQDEIQTILWSIEDGVPIAEFPLERQCYLTKILSDEEIQNIDGSSIDYEQLRKECVPVTEPAPPQKIASPEEAMKAYRSGAYFSPEDQKRYEETLESNVEKGLVPKETLEMYRLSMEIQKQSENPNGLDKQKLEELQAKANELSESAKKLEQQLRGMLTSLTAKYEEIERVAVLFGRPPEDKNGEKIPERRWSYHPDGYYIRFKPDGYSETAIEVYVPEKLEVTRDEKGRITSVRDAIGNCIRTTYDDSKEPLTVSGEPNLIGYPMSSIVFDYVHLDKPVKRLHLQWQTSAWTFVGVPTKKGRLKSDPDGFPGAERRYKKIVEIKSEMDSLDKQFNPTGAIDSIMDLASYSMALEEAYGDLPVETFSEGLGSPRDAAVSLGHYGYMLKPELIPGMSDWDRFPAVDLVKKQWLYEVSLRERPTAGEGTGEAPSEAMKTALASVVTDALGPVLVAAGGPSTPPGPRKIEFDPSGIVAVPGNSSEQRLGMSVPPKTAEAPPRKNPDKSKCDQIKRLERLIEELKKIRELYGEMGTQAKNWNDLEKMVEDAFKQWLSDTYPGEYPAGTKPGTASYGGADPCSGKITKLPNVCEPPYNYPFPLCDYMNGAAEAHEDTHIDDAANNPTDRGTFCSDDEGLAQEQVNIAVKWEQNAYDVQIKYLEQALDDLKSQLEEPCE